MFEKFSRSWTLVKASASVLRSDSELLVFPLAASIAAVVLVGSFLAPAIGFGWLDQIERQESLSLPMLLWLFAFYLSQYFVVIFFNTALVGAAMIRLDGGDPTLADGLRIAVAKLRAIFGYALIAATVGLLLRMLEQRAGWIGRWVIGLIGAAWTLVTFLVVPILVARDIGPLDAVKESAGLLRRTWGENLIGAGGIGLSFGLLIALELTSGLVAAGIAFAAGVPGIGFVVLGLTALGLLALSLIQAALTGIYSAALYRYATIGEAPQGFDAVVLKSAFQHQR